MAKRITLTSLPLGELCKRRVKLQKKMDALDVAIEYLEDEFNTMYEEYMGREMALHGC